MASMGQINYLSDKSLSHAVNILAKDIAKKTLEPAKGPQYEGRLRENKDKVDKTQDVIGHLGSNDEEKEEKEKQEEEEEAPTRIKTKSRKGYVGDRTLKKNLKIIVMKKYFKEDNEEGEEEKKEEPSTYIKIKSKKGYIKGGKGMAKMQKTRILKKNFKVCYEKDNDEKEEEEKPPIKIKTKSGKGYIGEGKGMVKTKETETLRRNQRMSVSKNKKYLKEDNGEEEEEEVMEEEEIIEKEGTSAGELVNSSDDRY
ncbi:hypothetical protein EV426DRAFT_579138 [Tirmania nivea]|nr:hypothetical protein EV426DRAFT_579138 [Tirmania nivea]